ncbi:hypothetical protein Plhal304r1_c024g0081801 [Plasmopara halstedii]
MLKTRGMRFQFDHLINFTQISKILAKYVRSLVDFRTKGRDREMEATDPQK